MNFARVRFRANNNTVDTSRHKLRYRCIASVVVSVKHCSVGNDLFVLVVLHSHNKLTFKKAFVGSESGKLP